MSESPLISIIMPSFNQGQFIDQALSSVTGQNYPNIELIVVDGGSTDNTAEVVEKYRHVICCFVSEPDRGQADAINKGFRLAQGDILAWLNTDDFYLPCTLARAAAALGPTNIPNLVYGGCFHFYEGTTHSYAALPPEFDAVRLTYQDYLIQPSTFWTRALWEQAGELSDSYHYVLDWDWFLKASRICRFTPIHEYLSVYRMHPAHKSGTGQEKRQEEILCIIDNYADPEWQEAYRTVYRELIPLRRSLHRLWRLNLYWLRFCLYPTLYRKYGKERIEEIILGMLVVPDIMTEPGLNKLKPPTAEKGF